MKRLTKILLRFLPCAFDAANMNRLQAGTVTVWAYKTADVFIGTVDQSAYFDAHAPLLRAGDLILVSSGDGGTPLSDFVVVSSADNATPVTTA